jgi:hypothetical protein
MPDSSKKTDAEWVIWEIVRDHVKELLGESDKRYNHRFDSVSQLLKEKDLRDQQRFDAQGSAVEAALLAQKEAVNAALIAADRAVAKAEIASEKRFEGLNELREVVTVQQAALMPRMEADRQLKVLDDKLEALRVQMKDVVPRVEHEATAKSIAAAADSRNMLIDGQLKELAKWQSERTGMSSSLSEIGNRNLAIVISIVGLVGSVIGALIVVWLGHKT